MHSGTSFEKLGLSSGADEAEIESAFRKLARVWHADKLPAMADPVQTEASRKHANSGLQLLQDAKRELLGRSCQCLRLQPHRDEMGGGVWSIVDDAGPMTRSPVCSFE